MVQCVNFFTKKAGSNETWVAVFRLGYKSSSPTPRTLVSRVVSTVFSSVPFLEPTEGQRTKQFRLHAWKGIKG